jgi:DNA replication protein DnaC
MYEDRVNMCLYGANGAGKSFLSSLIVKEAYRLRYSSYMTTLASMIDLNFKGNKSQDDYERIKFIKSADFLVIDEIGKETFTKTSSNIALLEETLRNAVKTGQVVILCTNLPLEEEGGLYEQYGASIQSLIEGSYVKIEFDGKDYRPTVFKKKKALAILQGEE